jgi:transposase
MKSIFIHYRAITKETGMKKYSTYVGLDVHKNSISIAIAEGRRQGEVRYYGSVNGTLASLDKVVKKIDKEENELYFVYEAGPCGYGIYRHLTKAGYHCAVVAPSRIPRRSGDRVKNDRRDSESLARLHRSGELTAIYVPAEEDEAMRDLTRGREDAVKAQRVVRQELGAFLLRHGFRYSGKTHWSAAHRRWFSDLKLGHPGQHIMLQEYINAEGEAGQRVKRLTEQIRQLVNSWRMAPVVRALGAMRGISLIAAATIVAEIGDMRRFAGPREVMSYLGLNPSEHSSGDRIKRGHITKTGNGHVRRTLIEAAQAYSHPARVGRVLLGRQESLPKKICDLAWRAQLRLCGRFRQLCKRGKHRNTVITAIARELSGFVWAMFKEVAPQAAS